MNDSSLRKRKLSSGWYPDSSSEIKGFIENALRNQKQVYKNKKTVIVPHAGWSFSGNLAVNAINTITANPEVVVVIGGHLSSGSYLHYAPEELFETPLGNMHAAEEFIRRIGSEVKMVEDSSPDNTVEVIIPIVKYFYPKSRLVWLRIGSGTESIELGALIYKIALDLKLETIVIGSTDLTHYGSNFMFSPVGSGPTAVSWVKEKNDRDIIDKMLRLDCRGVLESANTNFSACSSGGACAAINFAKLSGVSSGELIDYYTSYDISPSESFVGYAGISF